MRRLPTLELVMAAIVVVSIVLVLRATGEAEVLVDNEWACFWMLGRLDRSGPLPEDLAPVDGTTAYRHAGYLFTAYRPGARGPEAADLAEVLAGDGPYLALAWPEEWEVTGRRAFMLRSPGFIVQTENDGQPITGLPVPTCPWPDIEPPAGDPMDPEQGTPRGWKFLHRRKQRPRLQALGLSYTDRSKKKRE